MSRRTERIAGQLQEEIARTLRRDVGDPRLALVTLTRVDVAPDLSHALVFWSIFDAQDERSVDVVQERLDAAAPFLRGRLARELSLRRVPQLRFRYDPSLEQGSQTLRVLREISDEQKA